MPDLSIVIVPTKTERARNLHKTILNLNAALSFDTRRLSYEIRVAGSDEISDYLTSYPNGAIRTVEAGSLLKELGGRLIVLIDEGSLFSPNWLFGAIDAIQKSPTHIIHTELTVFRENNAIWHKSASTDNETVMSLPVRNQWDTPLLADVETLMTADPIKDLWRYSQDCLAEGYEHIPLPESIHFSKADLFPLTPPDISFSKLYSSARFEPLLSFPTSTPGATTTRRSIQLGDVKETLRKSHVWMKSRSRVYKAAVMPVLRRVDKKVVEKKIPDWAIAAWKTVHIYDRTTFPTRDSLHALHPYHTINPAAGAVFLNLLQHTRQNPDYLFVSQHMMKGGGDKVVLNYINALAEAKPEWKLMLLIAEPFKNTWSDKVPPEVDYLDFGNTADGLDRETRYILLARFIVQLRTKRLMLAMTPFGFELIEKFPHIFDSPNYQIDAVAFCSDTDKFGRTWGIHFYGIPENIGALHKVFTDNQQVIDETLKLEPLPRDKFIVHYQPVRYTLQPPRPFVKDKKLTILWASRIANQKRPDIVIAIAKRLASSGHTIDMYGNLEDEYTERDFQNIASLKYKGGFDGFGNLPLEHYDALLYTSSFDGVPNVILEATAHGLPVIAPNVGGVGEFIVNGETGTLINDIEDIEAFARAIDHISAHPAHVEEMTKKAQQMLATRHSDTTFLRKVKKDLAS